MYLYSDTVKKTNKADNLKVKCVCNITTADLATCLCFSAFLNTVITVAVSHTRLSLSFPAQPPNTHHQQQRPQTDSTAF